jgi:anti-anti-sigma factor
MVCPPTGSESTEVFMIQRPTDVAPAPANLMVTVKAEPPSSRVTVEGELDILGEWSLTDKIGELLRAGQPEVVLDVSRLAFCDARGLATILGFRCQLRNAGLRLTLCGPSPQLRRLLVIAGMDVLLDDRAASGVPA